uniref:Uncharacterized protein n=1 Tax=Biomphalaria glabrata TaxID=6526 RepID=A0A2C9M7D0_BIOGL
MAASSELNSRTDSDDDDGDSSTSRSSSSGGIETQISSWTYICKSFSDMLKSGDKINLDYVFKSAEQAVLNEEPVHALKLFAMGFKQICNENCDSHFTFRSRSTTDEMRQNEKPYEAYVSDFNLNLDDLIEMMCVAINQCAILITNENKTKNINGMKLNVKQCLELIINSCELLSLLKTRLICSAASLYFSLKDYQKGFQLATKAVQADSSSTLAQETYENMCCHLVERWHFAMLNDVSRNQAYQRALCEAIGKVTFNPVVCDVGSGTGLLSLIACEQGKCSQVYAIEKSSIMCMVAQDILKTNLSPELIQRVQIVNKMSTTMSVPDDMKQSADILVTETFDAGLFGEGILPTLCHAWSKLLQNTGSTKALVIPSKAELFIQAVECDYIRMENRFSSGVADIEFQNIFLCSTTGMCDPDPYTTQDLKLLPGGFRVLSQPVKFMEVDFNNPKDLMKLNKGLTQEISLTITKEGRLDALAMWFTLHLNDSVQISTHTQSNSCWEQAIFPVHAVKIQKQPESRGQKVSLNLKIDDIVHVIQCVKGGKLCMDVTSLSKRGEKMIQCYNITQPVPKFLSSVSDWFKHQVFCLSSGEIISLNNKDFYAAIIHQIKSSNKGEDVDFVHLNIGFSPLCLVALQSGYRHSLAIAHSLCHQVLLRALCRCNNIDMRRLSLVDDIDGFVNLLELSDPRDATQSSETENWKDCQVSERKKVHVLCDVVDVQGRIVENLWDQLNVLKYCLSDYTIQQVIPYQVDIYGVLIESQDLICLSRILSDENTLGYNIGSFFNKFSTRNYQGILLSTLSHSKLTEPFKIFSVSLNKIFHVQNDTLQSKSSPVFSSTSQQTTASVNVNIAVSNSVDANSSQVNNNVSCNIVNVKSSQCKERAEPSSVLQNLESQSATGSKHYLCSHNHIIETSLPSNTSQCPQCSVLTSSTPDQVSPCQSKSLEKDQTTMAAENTFIPGPNNNKNDAFRFSHFNHSVDGATIEVDSLKMSNEIDTTLNKLSSSIPSPAPIVSQNNVCHSESSPNHKPNNDVDETLLLKDDQDKGEDETNEMNQIQRLQIPVIESGNITALIYWFDLHMSPTVSISTLSYPQHWQQAAVMVPHSPSVVKGEFLDIQFKLGNSALSLSFCTK